MNRSEMIVFLQINGYPANSRIPVTVLEEAIRDLQEKGYTNSLEGARPYHMDEKRREIMDFLAQHEKFFHQQFGCDGNCFGHPDGQVALCYMTIHDKLP